MLNISTKKTIIFFLRDNDIQYNKDVIYTDVRQLLIKKFTHYNRYIITWMLHKILDLNDRQTKLTTNFVLSIYPRISYIFLSEA